LLFFLQDAYAVGEFAGEFNEKFFPGLSGVILDHIEVVECELFPFEADDDVAPREYLSIHGFDEVESWFIGFNLANTRGYFILDEGVHEVLDGYRGVHLLVLLELEF